MYFTPLDLSKFALLILNPLYFRGCSLLIANILFYLKPDDSGRNLMTQARELS